jgi:hypothetical protein
MSRGRHISKLMRHEPGSAASHRSLRADYSRVGRLPVCASPDLSPAPQMRLRFLSCPPEPTPVLESTGDAIRAKNAAALLAVLAAGDFASHRDLEAPPTYTRAELNRQLSSGEDRAHNQTFTRALDLLETLDLVDVRRGDAQARPGARLPATEVSLKAGVTVDAREVFRLDQDGDLVAAFDAARTQGAYGRLRHLFTIDPNDAATLDRWPGGGENARAYYERVAALCREVAEASYPDPADLRKLANADWAVLVRGELAALLEFELPESIRPPSRRDARSLARRTSRGLGDPALRIDPEDWVSRCREFGVRANSLARLHPEAANRVKPPTWLVEPPPMIGRTAGADLENALRNGTGSLILVEGPPAAGKTRLVHHTLGQIAREHTVLLAAPKTREEIALSIARVRRDIQQHLLTDPCERVLGVIFVEDVELYTSTSHDARDGLDGGLLRIIKDSEPVVIVATVGGKNAHLARLTGDPEISRRFDTTEARPSDLPEAHFSARTIEQVAYTLADLREQAVVVPVSPFLDEQEQRAARDAGYSDKFLNSAPDGPGARFTAAEALLEHYERLPESAQAVIDALVAWRRHVTANAIPAQSESLRILWRAALGARGKHVAEERLDPELDIALELATREAPSIARRPAFRVGTSVDVDDHLAQYPPARAVREIDDDTFAALLVHLSPAQAREAGLIARGAAPDRTFAAWRSAAGEDSSAAFSLAAYLEELNRPADEVIAAYGRAIDLGSVDAANSFALYLLRIERPTDEVIAAFERGISLGSADAALNLASLIHFMGLPGGEFIGALRRAVELGSEDAERIVSVFEAEREREREEHVEFLKAEALAGSAQRARELAAFLREHGGTTEEVVEAHRAAVSLSSDADRCRAALELAELLREHNYPAADVVAAYEQAIEGGETAAADPKSKRRAGYVIAEVRHYTAQAAIAFAQYLAELGTQPGRVADLCRLVREEAASGVGSRWDRLWFYEQAAKLGDPEAAFAGGRLVLRTFTDNDTLVRDSVRRWWRSAAHHGHVRAAWELRQRAMEWELAGDVQWADTRLRKLCFHDGDELPCRDDPTHS